MNGRERELEPKLRVQLLPRLSAKLLLLKAIEALKKGDIAPGKMFIEFIIRSRKTELADDLLNVKDGNGFTLIDHLIQSAHQSTEAYEMACLGFAKTAYDAGVNPSNIQDKKGFTQLDRLILSVKQATTEAERLTLLNIVIVALEIGNKAAHPEDAKEIIENEYLRRNKSGLFPEVKANIISRSLKCLPLMQSTILKAPPVNLRFIQSPDQSDESKKAAYLKDLVLINKSNTLR